MTLPRILVVDDHRDMADGIAMLLRELPAEVKLAYSAEQGCASMEESPSDLVLTDIRMPGVDGMQLLEILGTRWPDTKVILLTAYGSIDSAVEAMKKGACDYLTKPFNNEKMLAVVRKVLEEKKSGADRDASSVVGEVAIAVSPDDLLPSLDSALDLLREATSADDCEIFLREPEGGDLLLSACRGPDRDVLNERVRFTYGVGYPGIVVATKRPLLTRNLADDPRYLRRGVVERGLRSCACVPLFNLNNALGSLHIFSRSKDFPVDDARVLLEQAAIPISNAVIAGLATLRQSVDAICDNLDDGWSEQALRELLHRILRMAGARNGTLSLMDKNNGKPVHVISSGPVRFLCEKVKAGRLPDCVFLSGGHAKVLSGGRRYWPSACQGLPLRATNPCCLPLMTKKRLYGVVVLDFGRQAPQPTTRSLVPLLAMTQQAAVGLKQYHTGLLLDRERGEVDLEPASSKDRLLELRCLGPFTICLNGEPIALKTFPRSKAVMLLKILVLKAPSPVTWDTLVDLLWPGVDPKSGNNRLHGVFHALRSVIEPYKSKRQWVYACNENDLYYFNTESPHRVDLFDFRDKLALAERALRQGRPMRERITYLEEATRLYKGELFEEDPYAGWCQEARRELQERYIEALKTLAELHGHQGKYKNSIDCLRLALKYEPLREDLHQALIEMLLKVGRRSDALAQYQQCVLLVEKELDAKPLPETVQLYQRLLAPRRGRGE